MDFARALAGGRAEKPQDMQDALRAWGAPDDVLQAQARRLPPVFEVADINWEAVMVYQRCSTQWRVGMAGATGLDYPALESVMRMTRVQDQADCLERVQVIEFETLAAWAERREAAPATPQAGAVN